MTEEHPKVEPKEAIKAERAVSPVPSSGIITTRRRPTEYKPPLARDEEGGELPPTPEELRIEEEEQKLRRATRGKVPILASTVRIPMRFEGEFLANATGWDGWRYSDAEMDDVWLLVQQLGLEASPALQLFGIIVGMHGARLAAFVAWKKKGVRKITEGRPEEEKE